MNLNVKMDVEEEQPVQYVNRFAINIPSGTAAFNLNFVNSGLGNQSYILNPMNPVGQNIVTYQPPMALQSYIALPAEGEGNIIHSLPVGMHVPVGLPVSTGLLQNNFVNTSIIIGNEDSSVLKSSQNNINPENEIKINFIEKPVEELNCDEENKLEVQSIGVDCSSQTSPETVSKKPCPLEMSIKAANIDIEFEKCEQEVPIILGNCPTIVDKTPLLMENMSLDTEIKPNVIKVPLDITSIQTPIVEVNQADCKKIKTEITWENNNKEESVDNGFQESLICEVEEANDDEEEVENDDKSESESESEAEEDFKKKKFKINSVEVQKNSELSAETSSEESDCLPLSVALKFNNPKSNKSCQQKRTKKKRDESLNDKDTNDGNRKQKKFRKSKKQDEGAGEQEENDWSESDDDVLNLKRIKNDFNYKCFYEPNSTKSATSLVLKIDDQFKKFVRVRNCCSKWECGKRISVQDQKIAHKKYYDLESDSKRDAYLMNCIEYVIKVKNLGGAKGKPEEQYLEKANIQMEIEHESNGNQKLSDEIQNAIKESLKDCIANEFMKGEEEVDEYPTGGEKNTWDFYIDIDRCRKRVCLQFLLKLFQVPKNKIKQLQKKILSGTPLLNLGDNLNLGEGNLKFDVWELAKLHLDGLEASESTDCNANPRHRFLLQKRTKQDLFESFKDFYFSEIGKELNIKYASYKRFLDRKTSISFESRKEGICSECKESTRHKKRKQQIKNEKILNKGKKSKESKKQWMVKDSDSEENSSEDEPLLKRKKLKLKIPLKAVNCKSQTTTGKRTSKKFSVETKSKGKTKQTSSRGRDVWSLMLLHLETMPYKECRGCINKKKHRFLDSTFTTQGLFEDYRKYFLKETNSELGLGFTMYEKYFNRNCNYSICDIDVNSPNCPLCVSEGL